MSAAAEGQARSRLRERHEAQDRRSRPRVLAAVDARAPLFVAIVNEAARRRAIE